MPLLFARQPIFDKNGRRFGYELLYREPGKNIYDAQDGDMATSSVMAAGFLSMGVGELSDQSRAFINFTENMLLKGVATLFPRNQIIVELLENINPTPEVIKACRELRARGYQLALDDYVLREDYEQLVEMATYIKVDFMQLKTENERQEIIIHNRGRRIRFLAEKVETREDYDMAIRLGYELFQGYFFAKPVVVNSNSIPYSKFNQIRLMQLLDQPDPSIEDIAGVIEKDVAFTYEILKLTRTVRYYRGNKIHSIRQAAMLMGMKELKKWAYITIIRRIGDHGQEENIRISVQRARVLEQLCDHVNCGEAKMAYFTLGLLSMIDVLTGCDMKTVLPELPITTEMRNILQGTFSDSVMSTCFQLSLAYEKGQWILAEILAEKIKLDINELSGFYLDAVGWSNQASS